MTAMPERMPAGWHTRGSVCGIREPAPGDDAALDRLRSPGVVSEFEDYGPDAVLVRPASPDPGLGPSARVLGRGTVVDAVDGSVLGLVSWHVVGYGPTAGSQALNIGISLLPQARGRGVGAQAQRMLAAVLMETFGVARVEAATDVRNRAEQRSLERAGFTREGVARGAQERRGVRHDLVVYALLASDVGDGAGAVGRSG